MFRTLSRWGVVSLLLGAAVQNSSAHTCPIDATATGVGVTVTALRTNGAPIGTGTVAPCEPIIVQMAVVYIPIDPITGGKNAAFQAGVMFLMVNGISNNVTPPGGVPLIGGDGTEGCNGSNSFVSLKLPYTVTEADAAVGMIPIKAAYTNGNAHIGTDLNGVVSGTQGFTVRTRPGVSCEIDPQTNSICPGGSAMFTVTATNGTAPYTFTWTGPGGFNATGPTITASNAGVYIATVTDFYGCTNTCQARLIVNPNPVCSISPPSAEFCVGAENCVDFIVTPSGGTAPYRIVWGTGATSLATNVTTSNATFRVCATAVGTNVYTASITDANGCTGRCTATVIVNPNPVCSISPPNAELCLGPGNCVDFVVTPSGGRWPYTIVWNRAGTPIATNTTTTNATFRVCATSAGTNVYTAAITDANGCVGNCSATLVVTPNPVCVISPPRAELCFGPGNCVDYVVTPMGGEAPYTIVWHRGATPIATNTTTTNATFSVCATVLGTTNYVATVTDNNGCMSTCVATNIVRPNPACAIRPSSTNICLGSCIDFVVTVSGGTGPFTNIWIGAGGPIATNAPSGTNAATGRSVFTMCFSNAGTFSFTNRVIDAEGCVGQCEVRIVVNPNAVCSISPPRAELCFGPENCVDFVVTPAGGQAPYRIVWSRGATPIATNVTTTNATFRVCATLLGTNVYTASFTDINGCPGSCTATLIVNPNPACTISPPSAELCFGPNNCVDYVVTPSGGEGPYTIIWSRGGTALATNSGSGPATFRVCATILGPSIYRATVIDSNGCESSCIATNIVNPNPVCAISPSSTQVCVGASVTFRATASGGTPPYTFAWNGPGGFSAAGPNITITNAQISHSGTYTAIVTDANDCTNVCTATLRVTNCLVGIRVTKEVVCWTPEGCAPFTGSHLAVGARAGNNQCPSFCYRITVANVSGPGVELRNLVVSDPDLNLGGCGFPMTLGPVGSATASASCIIQNVPHCQTVTNVVTARATGVEGESGATLQTVTGNDTAVAVVVPIAIVCEKLVSSPADLDTNDGPGRVTLPVDGGPFTVTYGVAVSNASAVPLLAFVDDPALANCPLPSEFTNGIALAPFETRFWPEICTANLQCGIDPLDEPQFINTIVVSAIVDVSVTNMCSYTTNGAFVTASNSCQAIVECPQPAGCRVTGGGRQDATTRRGPLVYPLQGGGIDCLQGFPVRYVTHGGQVGAPVGRITEFDPDSDCIQGNWQHVRHAQGGRRANFHAKSFDSLMCACLGEGSEPGIVINGICNPDDKKNGLGPQPRKAPANKIAFSGVGDYTCQKGGRVPRTVLFRVDLEDRSEPGGFHPGGAQDPADRYRIRIWALTAAELAALNGAVNGVNDPFLCNFRRAIAATAQNTPLTDGALDGSGNAVPLGTAVFGVRRPDVDDGGELLHGNHQIHPQIQECTEPFHTCPPTP